MHNLSMQERNVTLLHGQQVQIIDPGTADPSCSSTHLFPTSTAQAVQFLLGTGRQWIPLCAGTLVRSQALKRQRVSDLCRDEHLPTLIDHHVKTYPS